MKSWDKNKDVFGNKGPRTEDHIWPIAKNGSLSSENIIGLTQESNAIKGDRNKGTINDIRFSITEKGRTDAGKVIGQMKVKINGEWHDVN